MKLPPAPPRGARPPGRDPKVWWKLHSRRTAGPAARHRQRLAERIQQLQASGAALDEKISYYQTLQEDA